MATMSCIDLTMRALIEGDEVSADELDLVVEYLQSVVKEKQGEERAL